MSTYKMSRKRRIKANPNSKDSYGKKYAESRPILDKKDVNVEISKPIETSVHAKTNLHTHIQIVNGVVCTTGKYSRLHEDYDDM